MLNLSPISNLFMWYANLLLGINSDFYSDFISYKTIQKTENNSFMFCHDFI